MSGSCRSWKLWGDETNTSEIDWVVQRLKDGDSNNDSVYLIASLKYFPKNGVQSIQTPFGFKSGSIQGWLRLGLIRGRR